MYGFLLTLLVLDGIFLTVVILLQSGKGGGLAAMGGGVTSTEGILGGRQATTVLTRATWIGGVTFMVLALVLAILSSRAQQPGSFLQQNLQAPAVPTSVIPGLDGSGAAAPAGTPAEGAAPAEPPAAAEPNP